MSDWQCGNCGMEIPAVEQSCPKCDTTRFSENRRQTLVADIAHDGQTLADAEHMLDRLLRQAALENYGRIRLITGRGLIHREVDRWLDAALWQDRISDYRAEDHNPGAILISMKP